MKKLTALFTSSSQELRQVSTVTVCAMMAAIGVVLGSLTIYLTDTLRIGFAGIPITLVGYMFGPVVGGLFGGVLDILKFFIKPMGPFMPGMTLIAMFEGLLYGCILYRKPLNLGRVLSVQLVVAVVCNIFLITLCLSLVYGKAFMVLLVPRIAKNLIMWPIDSLIFFNLAKVLEMAGAFRILGKMKNSNTKE